jgi:uncharacterized membrane protein
MMKNIFAYFLQGLLFIAPIFVTGYIIFVVFDVIDGNVQKLLFSVAGIKIPGLGIIALFVFLTFLGLLGNTFIAKPIKSMFNSLIEKAPIIKAIYSAIRDLFSAFAGKDKKFDKPVLVKVDANTDFYRMGFITEMDLSKISMLEHVCVYFPSSYGVLGEMLIVPKEVIRNIDVSPTDAMKFIVSGGVAGWD